ncbi:hypothetical protein HZH68_005175 [Vespula germanica]|uniref:Uncharacterized protein n=1 Tax=Vespula germanica TaxID=30212 RepID=A0A834KH75_VESGE|nr:hypothetical protein HZH68_005175 [Vespula germanica]
MNRREVQSHRETSIENDNVASTRMCCSDGPGGTRLTRCGVVCGLAALAALSTALLGPAWLHTEEKVPLSYISNNSPILVSVRFKLGLFRVCPKIVKPSNLTIRSGEWWIEKRVKASKLGRSLLVWLQGWLHPPVR